MLLAAAPHQIAHRACRVPHADRPLVSAQEVFRREKPPIFHVQFGPNKINMHTPELWRGATKLRGEVFTLKAPAARPGCGDFCFVWTGAVPDLLQLLTPQDSTIIPAHALDLAFCKLLQGDVSNRQKFCGSAKDAFAHIMCESQARISSWGDI